MLGSFFGLFGCAHRRLTRPITPVSKPGVPSGETYVVCLECGKQFAYDWNRMRIGKAIEKSADSGVLHPEMPGPAKTKIKYALFGSAIPLAVLLGRALASDRRSRTGTQAANSRSSGPVADSYIDLPHGGPGAGFNVSDLVQYIDATERDYIITGDVDCALADHPRPSSLDYWLREKFARNKETKQATDPVIRRLVSTGWFERVEDLRCPDTGQKSAGLKLKVPTKPEA